jgi:phenylacetate-CoA ligase
VSEETGVRPTSLREARTFGETLDPGIREKCRDLWDVPVTDVYSTEEFGTIAYQCPVATNFHVMAENVLVEVLDGEGNPCQPGETGQVVVTSLNNFATPFIRAVLGDMAVAGAPCACGRGLPVIERIIGRERNLFVRPDGARVFPEFYREMTMLPPVRQFQLTQKTVELVEVKLAVTRALTAHEEDTIRGFLAGGFGHAFNLDFVYVDEIPVEPNGKYQDYRSEVTASKA